MKEVEVNINLELIGINISMLKLFKVDFICIYWLLYI